MPPIPTLRIVCNPVRPRQKADPGLELGGHVGLGLQWVLQGPSFWVRLSLSGHWTQDWECIIFFAASEKGWCSTWGADHFSTFDHHEYEFKGMCNYIFTATCGDASPTFSIQLRRDRDGNISRIIMELGASVVTVNKAIISVRDIG